MPRKNYPNTIIQRFIDWPLQQWYADSILHVTFSGLSWQQRRGNIGNHILHLHQYFHLSGNNNSQNSYLWCMHNLNEIYKSETMRNLGFRLDYYVCENQIHSFLWECQLSMIMWQYLYPFIMQLKEDEIGKATLSRKVQQLIKFTFAYLHSPQDLWIFLFLDFALGWNSTYSNNPYDF